MVKERFSHIGPFSLLFLLPVTSLSPLDLASSVPVATRVRMVVGSEDPTAPPKFTQEYAEALRKRGIDVKVTVAPGLGHNILLEPVVLQQLKDLVATVKGSPPGRSTAVEHHRGTVTPDCALSFLQDLASSGTPPSTAIVAELLKIPAQA